MLLSSLKPKFYWTGVILLIFAPTSYADQWTVDAKIQQTAGYNDNVRMSQTPQGSMYYTLIPVVNFSHKTDNSLVDASASYGVQRYSSISTLNNTLQDYKINGNYLTERSTWAIAASMNIAPSFNTASMYSGNFSSNSESTTMTLSPSVSYKLTEFDTLRLDTNYSQISYTGTDFRNSETQSISLNWQRFWSERFSNNMGVSYSKNQSKVQTSDTYSLNLGLNFILSEQWTIAGSVGGRFTSFESNSIKYQSQGFLLNAGLNYKKEKLSSQLGISRSLLPSSQGQLQEQDSVNLSFNYPISERLSTALTANYLLSNNSATNDQNMSRQYMMFQPTLNWQIDPDWTLSASYQYRNQHATGSQNTGLGNGFSNSGMLLLNYNWQGLSLSR